MQPVTVDNINAMLLKLHEIKPDASHLIQFEFISGIELPTTFVRVHDITDNTTLNETMNLGWALYLALQYYILEIAPSNDITPVDEDNFNTYYQVLQGYFKQWNIDKFFVIVFLDLPHVGHTIYLMGIPEKYFGLHIRDIAMKITREITSAKEEIEFKAVIREGRKSSAYFDGIEAVKDFGMLMTSLILGTADIQHASTLVDSNGNNFRIQD